MTEGENKTVSTEEERPEGTIPSGENAPAETAAGPASIPAVEKEAHQGMPADRGDAGQEPADPSEPERAVSPEGTGPIAGAEEPTAQGETIPEAAETPVPSVEERVYPEEVPGVPVQPQEGAEGASWQQAAPAPGYVPGYMPQTDHVQPAAPFAGTPVTPVYVPQGGPGYPLYGEAQNTAGVPVQQPMQSGYPYPQTGYGQQPGYGAPVYQPGQPAPQQSYYAPPQYGAPQWGYAQQPGQPPYPPYGQVPPKKKMSTGLKVFIWIASILAAVAIFGFGGYLIYNAANGNPSQSFNGMPDDWSQLPDNGGDYRFPMPQEPDEDDDVPDFDDGVTPPDTDEPLPDVDVTPNNEGITIHQAPGGEELSAQQVYEKVVKSTVTVAVTLEQSGVEHDSTGTGIIATSDGYMITNAHVVLNSKSSRVKITTCDGQEYDAVVVGMDRTTDLAVLKTNDHNFTPAEFGDAGELVIGDSVIAIGNPGGAKFSGSMTGGYVSGLDRAVGKYSENGMTFLQTDAAINPGNSGGPLVNMYGQVVGINSSKIITEGYEGMGFAIPVSKAQPIINELLSGGYVKGRVRLGITGSDVSEAMYTFGGMPQGFMIIEIGEDSAFAGTEAKEGDIITAIDGEEVANLDEISNLLLKYAPGDKITVTLYRSGGSGREIDVEIVLLEDKGETQK